MFAFVLTVLIALGAPSASPSVVVVDAGGAPLAGARVVFVDASGARDLESTGDDGAAAPRAGFVATAAEVGKDGFAPVRVVVHGIERVVLERTLATIGSVSVATGSAQSLHQSPLAAAVLDRTALAAVSQAASDRILRALPGADRTRSNSAFTNYGQLRASFSGAGNDRGAVYVDGVPAQDGFGGQIDWQAYPGAALERAELFRGAGSALYGSGAIGGALDITTFGPRVGGEGASADGRLVADVGSNGKLDGTALLRVPLGRTVGAALVTSSDRFTYRDLAPGYTSPVDRPAVSTSGTSHFRVRYSDGATVADAAVLVGSDHQDEGRTNYAFDRTLRQTSLSASHALADGLARVAYYGRDATVYNLSDVYPTSPGTLRYVQHVPTHEDGFVASYVRGFGPLELHVRIDEKRVLGSSTQTGPTNALQSFGAGVETAQGVALQTTLRTSHVELVAGARADALRYDDLALVTANASPAPAFTRTAVAGHTAGAISPRIAVRVDLGSRLALRASSGTGFRGPYLNELVRGFTVGKIQMTPNPSLSPERSLTSGIGLDYLLGAGRLALDAVQIRVRDAIAYATLSPTVMQQANLERTQTESYTLSYVAPLGACSRVRLSGTTQRPLIASGPAGSAGKQLAYVPSRSADLGIDAAGRGGLGFSVDGSYVGQTFADNFEAQPLGAALLFGATLRAVTASGATFALVADNLTKQAYLSSIDRYGPPQTIALRVGIPLGPARAAETCR